MARSRTGFGGMGGFISTPGNGNGNGNGDDDAAGAEACGCDRKLIRKMGGWAAMRYAAGHLNSGLTQCIPDMIMQAIARGECAVERVQCRTPISLRATLVAAGATVVHTWRPVGLAVVREIQARAWVEEEQAVELNLVRLDVTPDIWLTQWQGGGRSWITDNVSSTGTGQPAQGFSLNAFAREYHNYAASNGLWANSDKEAQITLQNVGALNDVNYDVDIFYDLLRLG